MAGPLSTYLDCTPSGTLNKDGFMEFTAPMSAVSVTILSRTEGTHPHLEDDTLFEHDGGTTRAQITANNSHVETCFAGEVGTHAVVIGRMRTYACLDDGSGHSHGYWLMLIKRHEDDDGNESVDSERWHKTGMSMVDMGVAHHFHQSWKRKKIRIGGMQVDA